MSFKGKDDKDVCTCGKQGIKINSWDIQLVFGPYGEKGVIHDYSIHIPCGKVINPESIGISND